MDINQIEEQEAINFWKKELAKFDEEEQQQKAKTQMREVRETIADLRSQINTHDDPSTEDNLER